MYDFLYKIGLLKVLNIFFKKIINLINNTNLFIERKELVKRGSYIGENCYLHPSVTLRISENSRLKIGNNVTILNNTWLITEDGDELTIGDNTFVSQNVVISGNVKIGNNVLIAGYVSIIDANHNYSDIIKNINEQGGNKKDIIIGDDVWIGTHSIVLQGVTIEDHSIIGANSTVTHNIESYTIAAGSPAKIVNRRK